MRKALAKVEVLPVKQGGIKDHKQPSTTGFDFALDARCLDAEASRELLRIVPQLVHIRRAWKARFLKRGCLHCKSRKSEYGAGGLCRNCYAKIAGELREYVREAGKDRDIPKEIEALSRKFDVAQRLLT